MDEAEKLAAVKKAYAEIILNTAKEAAARVMAAERKALRFQDELRSTKDDALTMLLRLKEMLDSKTTETEITTLSQQRKIEELDAQLNEAEEIITDLRFDLKQARDKLEKVENEKKQHLNEISLKQSPGFSESHTHEDETKTSKTIIAPSVDSVLETITTPVKARMPLNQTILEGNCGNAISAPDVEKYNVQDSGFASIVMSNKEPKLYRNGCTQRIHAIGRELPDGNMHPSSDEENQNPGTKIGLIIKATDKDEGKCMVSCAKIMETEWSFGEVKRPVRARSVRIRKNRFGKDKATSCISFKTSPKLPNRSRCYKSDFVKIVKKGNIRGTLRSRNAALKPPPDQFSEPCPAVPSVSGNVKSGEDQLKMTKNKLKMKPVPCLDSAVRNIRETLRSRNAALKPPPEQFSEPCLAVPSVSGNVKSGEDQSKVTKNKLKMKPVPCLDSAVRSIKPGADLVSGLLDVTISTGTLNDCDLSRCAADNKGRNLTDELVLQEPTSPNVANLESKGELFDVPLVVESDLKDLKTSELSERSLGQTGNDRHLKYTFARKRKKTLTNPDQKKSPVGSSAKRRVIEKQTSLPEPQTSNLLNESSRDSSLLEQVADQLISLSDERWWG